jgi:ankyrin repeat protein
MANCFWLRHTTTTSQKRKRAPTPDRPNKEPRTENCLLKAVTSQNYEEAKQILQSGVSPNIMRGYYETPFCIAIQNNDYFMTKLLLDHTYDLHVCNGSCDGYESDELYPCNLGELLGSSIIIACENNNLKIFNLLLKYKAKLDKGTRYCPNGLYEKLSMDKKDIIDSLVRYHNNDQIRKHDFLYALFSHMINWHRYDVALYVIQRHGLQVTHSRLYYLCTTDTQNNIDAANIIEYALTKYSIDVNAIHYHSETLLHVAVMHEGNSEIIKVLVKYGARFNVEYARPLVWNIHPKLYNLLEQLGMDFTTIDKDGYTTLMSYYKFFDYLRKDSEIALEFLAKRVNINHIRKDTCSYTTALSINIFESSSQYLPILLRHGADINYQFTLCGLTLFEYMIIRSKRLDIALIMLEYQTPVTDLDVPVRTDCECCWKHDNTTSKVDYFVQLTKANPAAQALFCRRIKWFRQYCPGEVSKEINSQVAMLEQLTDMSKVLSNLVYEYI